MSGKFSLPKSKAYALARLVREQEAGHVSPDLTHVAFGVLIAQNQEDMDLSFSTSQRANMENTVLYTIPSPQQPNLLLSGAAGSDLVRRQGEVEMPCESREPVYNDFHMNLPEGHSLCKVDGWGMPAQLAFANQCLREVAAQRNTTPFKIDFGRPGKGGNGSSQLFVASTQGGYFDSQLMQTHLVEAAQLAQLKRSQWIGAGFQPPGSEKGQTPPELAAPKPVIEVNVQRLIAPAAVPVGDQTRAFQAREAGRSQVVSAEDQANLAFLTANCTNSGSILGVKTEGGVVKVRVTTDFSRTKDLPAGGFLAAETAAYKRTGTNRIVEIQIPEIDFARARACVEVRNKCAQGKDNILGLSLVDGNVVLITKGSYPRANLANAGFTPEEASKFEKTAVGDGAHAYVKIPQERFIEVMNQARQRVMANTAEFSTGLALGSDKNPRGGNRGEGGVGGR